MLRIFLLLTGLAASLSLMSQTTVTYQPSTADFPNPERGFYRYTETRSGSYDPLVQSELENFRNSYTSGGANYSVVSSLAFRYFFLEDFKGGPISQSYLDLVAADFATARAAGIKLIPRFAYTDAVNGNGCPSFICPPYGDAPKAVVLQHISQLAPILEDNKDVIAAVQMGFIGVWGENYYTDYFGDASDQGNGQLFDTDWQERNEVLAALLAAVPAERMVQVRYPQLKQRLIYGIDAPTSSAPLTAGEGYSGTDKARIGFHNDCLLASADDFGTYADYGNDNSGVSSDTATLKPYFAQDSRYVVVGGETCSDGYNPQNNCSSTNSQAFGDTELRRLHYSYLNTDYNQAVNNDWQSGGCMDQIKRSLGYRFTLLQGTYPASAMSGAALPFSINLINEGYAAPYNERKVELILRETTSGEVWRAALPDDPRLWQPESGTITLGGSPCLPGEMPTGTYELLLHLPDPMPALYGRADYSIRLGSLLPGGVDGWEPATGFNKLGQELEVTGGSSGCAGSVSFVADNAALPLQLLSFSGLQAGKHIRLNWDTRAEQNEIQHEVLRSDDGRNFRPIGQLAARNEGAGSDHYTFTDQNVSAGTTYYYQLRSVNLDGSRQLSPVVQIRVTGNSDSGLVIFPNPAKGNIQLHWQESPPEDATLSLYDVLGKLVFSGPMKAELSLQQLKSGTYTLVVQHANARWIQRLVKQ